MCQSNVSFKVTVPAAHVESAGGHERFSEKLKHALKTVGTDAAEVALIPLVIATGADK